MICLVTKQKLDDLRMHQHATQCLVTKRSLMTCACISMLPIAKRKNIGRAVTILGAKDCKAVDRVDWKYSIAGVDKL